MNIMTLANAYQRLGFKALGGEWCSWLTADGRERLWQGDPAVWAGQAPILFPTVGASAGGVVRIGAESYPHPKHGLVRHMQPSVVSHTDTELLLRWDDTSGTRAAYPFAFRFEVTYRLEGPVFVTEFRVVNTGTDPLPYQLGAHPAFALPLRAGDPLEAHFIEFPEPETAGIYGVTADGLLEATAKPYLRDERRIRLTADTFRPDALVFRELRSRSVEVGADGHGSRIRVRWAGFPHLGIWAKPGAAYVCIEPWQGCADTAGTTPDITRKTGIILLQSGADRVHRVEVEFLP